MNLVRQVQLTSLRRSDALMMLLWAAGQTILMHVSFFENGGAYENVGIAGVGAKKERQPCPPVFRLTAKDHRQRQPERNNGM